MTLSIRETTPDDLEEIHRIKTHELVRPHQYKLDATDTPEGMHRLFFSDEAKKSGLLRSTTILYDDRIIGHVIRRHYFIGNQPAVHCGWNLEPDFWGRGLMPQALTMLFQHLLETDGTRYVFADCFRSNHQCKRVLAKLGFIPTAIPLSSRVQIMIKMKSLHWVNRFYLDLPAWAEVKRSKV